MNNLFLDISVLLALTVTVAFVVRLLRQPLVVAYIVAGIIAGPIFLNVIDHDQTIFRAFAQLGVVLLLFVVGLSLNFHYIKKIGRVVAVAGISQAFITVIAGVALLRFFNFSPVSALYLAIAITFSSTIIIVKLLSEKRDLESLYGRYTIGLLLVQDVIAILIMLILTTVHRSGPLLNSFGLLVFKGFLVIAVVYFLSRTVLPFFLNRVAASSEFLFIFTIAWCFSVASMVYFLGFPVEIGAVIAGVSLGSSPYQFEIASKIKPLRDFFIVLFFIILGSEMNIADVQAVIKPGLVLLAFILIFKPLVLYLLFRFMRFTRRNSFMIALAGAQVSEFGFIILFTGMQLGFVLDQELVLLTLVALASIFISTYLITYSAAVYRFLLPLLNRIGPDKYQQQEEKIRQFDVWVVGYHRMGWKMVEMLKATGTSFAVVDHNPEAIAKLKRRGLPHFFGDIGDVEFLDMLPVAQSKLVIMTVPDPEDQLTFIEYVRARSTKPIIIASLQHSAALKDLYAAGANYVVLPHLLAGEWLGHVLKTMPWRKNTFSDLAEKQHEDLTLHTTMGGHH